MPFINPYKVVDNTIEIDLNMNENNALTSITHFPFLAEENVEGSMKINNFYQKTAINQQDYIVKQLLQLAMEGMSIDFLCPDRFRRYEWSAPFMMTYNTAPILSLYTDAYQYAGGAHGITLRTSQTWHVPSGEQMEFKEFFPGTVTYGEIKKEIIRQVEENRKQNPTQYQYFDNYEELIQQNFKPGNFYIADSPLRIVIYFQYYDISPYAFGMPEFAIPLQHAAKA